MEKLKDFFYDKNDLVVALVIIVAAALLIAWRVDYIMEYPRLMADHILQENPSDNTDDGQSDGAADGNGTGGSETDPLGSDDANGSDSNDSGQNDAGGSQTPQVAAVPPATNSNNTGNTASHAPKPSTNSNMNSDSSGGTLTVTIPSGSSGEKIAQLLVDAGAVSSKKEFTAALTAAKADTKLKAGTFKIPAGSSMDEVIAIITK